MRAERAGLRANAGSAAAAGVAKDKANWMRFSSISGQIVQAASIGTATGREEDP